MSDNTERQNLIAFLKARQWDHRDLGRVMKWSPTFIYGFLGGAWSLTDSFRQALAKTFGFEVTRQVFDGVTASAQEQPT